MAGEGRALVAGIRYKDMDFNPLREILGHIGESHPVTNHGTEIAMLSQDPETGANTSLLKLPPGWRSHGPEFHNVLQEQFLIEGDLSFAGERFEAPAYFCWPAKFVHGPSKSVAGALVFNIFAGPPHIEWTEYYENMEWAERG